MVERAFVLVIAALFAAVPDSGEAQRRAPRCTPETVDSAHVANGPVFRDCDVSRKAAVREEPQIDYDVMPGTCIVAELEFVVDTAGVPDTSQRILELESSDPVFMRELRRILPAMRFRPAEKDGVPVRQIVRLRKIRKGSDRSRHATTLSTGGAGMPRSSATVGSRSGASGAPPACR